MILHNVYSNNLAVGADWLGFRVHVDGDHISQQNRSVKAQLPINVFGKGVRICLLSPSNLRRSRKAAVLEILILGLCTQPCQLIPFCH